MRANFPRFSLALGGGLCLLLLGCVSAEHAEVEEAQREKERCVATRGESHPTCRALAERLKAAQKTYEARSRQAWGCDPAQEQCPTPR